MSIFTAIASIVSLVISALVLYSNPKRVQNRALSISLAHTSIWLLCVYFAMIEGRKFHALEPNDLAFWLRANAAVLGFAPAIAWLLLSSVDKSSNSDSKLRPTIFILLSIGCAILTTSDLFLLDDSSRTLKRGFFYYAYSIAGFSATALILYEFRAALKRSSGINRLEIRIISIHAGTITAFIFVANSIGNYLNIRDINRTTIVIVFFATLFTAWQITFNRVFNARETLLNATRYTIATSVPASIAALIIKHFVVFQSFESLRPLVALVCATAASSLALNHYLTRLFARRERRQLERAIDGVDQLSQGQLEHHALAERISDLLCRIYGSKRVSFFSREHMAQLRSATGIARDSSGYSLLLAEGWITPESLRRRRTSPLHAGLIEALEAKGVSLVIKAPRGARQPGHFLVFETKTDGSPFTYPEIQRLQRVSDLVDSVLVRSKLADQAILQAKLDHLALISRGLAHDLKNVLLPVSGYLTFAEGRDPPGTSGSTVLADARRSVNYMEGYIRETLFFAQNLRVRHDSIDASLLFAEICDIVTPRAARHAIILKFEDRLRRPLIGDFILLQRMLANLLANAIDASPAGQTVNLSAELAPGDRCRFLVVDQGHGIAPGHLARIFEPHFTTKSFGGEVRGFGLGLTIAERIVRLHHGSIAVESQPGAGTTFRIDLPLTPPTDPTAPAALPSVATPDPSTGISDPLPA